VYSPCPDVIPRYIIATNAAIAQSNLLLTTRSAPDAVVGSADSIVPLDTPGATFLDVVGLL